MATHLQELSSLVNGNMGVVGKLRVVCIQHMSITIETQ